MTSIVGWDIGGVHTKAAWGGNAGKGPPRTVSLPFEIWREPERLPQVLEEALAALAVSSPDAMAVTMTAELSDVFRHRSQGVWFVLDAVEASFPDVPTYLLDLDGRWATVAEARERPLDFAAVNWLASALYVAQHAPDCLLVDVGSTTTDLIPIRDGRVVSRGRTDAQRLAAGELVYTGVVRTNPNTLADWVPLGGTRCPLAAEYFAVMGDVHLILGHLPAEAYDSPTPDGRGKTLADARGRLARLVCADEQVLTPAEIDLLARHLYERQLAQIEDALLQVLSRFPGKQLPLVPVGVGAFMVREAGHRLNLPLSPWAGRLEETAVLPSLAVAQLLAAYLEQGTRD